MGEMKDQTQDNPPDVFRDHDVYLWQVVVIDGHQYFECDKCGALVANIVKHTGWHDRRWPRRGGK